MSSDHEHHDHPGQSLRRRKPLAGLRVLDLSRILAGPLATMWMADLGAEVIKLEHPAHGDETRRWGPPFVGGESAYFLAVNRGKRGVALNLTSAEGRRALRKLIATSDVLLHNFLPNVAGRLGLDYKSMRAVNPRIVYVSVSGFPPGPHASEPGFDALIQALGGLMAVTGEGERPLKVGVAIVDVLTAWAALCGTLAALLERSQSGEGQEVPLTLVECSAAALTNVSQDFLLTGREPKRRGTAHPHIAPYQAFPTTDGLLMLAVATDAQFARLCETLGRPDLARDHRFADNPSRVAHRDALVTLLSQEFSTRTRAECVAALKAAAIPAGPVNTLQELFGDTGLTGRLLVEVDHPTAGRYLSVGCPLPQAWPPSSIPPPRLGEHTEQVLCQR